MNETHGLSGLPELPSFALKRMGATVVIEPCPDGEHWHWTWLPDNAPETVPVQTGYMEITPEGPQPVMREVPWEPVVQHTTIQNVLQSMSPEEARLFMGWCSHVHEQLGAHLEAAADAVKLAVTERRWAGVSQLAEELHTSCAIRNNIDAAGKLAFDQT